VVWAVVALLIGACASGNRTSRRQSATPALTPTTPVPTDPTTAVPEPTVEHPREWVAVFRVAEVADLDADTEELLRLVPKNIAISPIGCWVGVRERLGNPTGESLYVSAVVADSREELDRVVRKVRREPILRGEFAVMCT
jgi:hypothetical protein